ncbi:uncharacterized protein [Macrobrachium rosenbergii]|uniref:uncharacterized protein n=1 Tax=Macrobrachium rosenbergii TaxID=79674 RepID=UPI0034D5076F
MQVLQIVLLVGCCLSWSEGQSFSFSFGTEIGPETVTSQTPRRASAIPNLPDPDVPKRPAPSATNEIGKSPCPRGQRGFSCRQQLALDALTCTSGQCLRCRQGCDSLSPSEWPICCRDHFLCCREVASSCQQCNTPQLVPFCTAAFKRCF